MNILVEKSDAFAAFKFFKNCVEKDTSLVIKCLRTYHGGEFTSSEFNEYCKRSGIKIQLTTAYTLQQKRFTERNDRTLMNMVRRMLSKKGIPKTFWLEAVNWAIYVLNRCPTLLVKDATPDKACSGVKPSVEHFQCTCSHS